MKFIKHRLESEFQQATGCTAKQAAKHTDRYIQACIVQVIRHLGKTTGSDRVYVSYKELGDGLQSVQVGKQRYGIWKTFSELPSRIFTEIVSGSNLRGEITMAKINYDLLELLASLNDSQEAVKEAYKPFINEMTEETVDLIMIDCVSLEAYLVDNRQRIQAEEKKKSPNQDYLDTLLENKKYAEIILCLSQQHGALMQVISESEFGRKYYKGVNLQNCPKIVRHAALGACYEYDIENSVFAWKLDFFNQLLARYNEKVSMPATLEYLDRKAAIRRRLARDIFGSDSEKWVKVIKQAITAIGFGANDRVDGFINKNGKYQKTSMNTIIKSRDKLTHFLNDSWVKGFYSEQETMNDVVIDLLRPTQEEFWKQVPDLYTTNGCIKKNSVMAYLYQQAERTTLNGIMELIDPENVLLTVHDCIYTKNPVGLKDIRGFLQEQGDYYRIGEEYHSRWYDKTEENLHKARIQEEERIARGYRSDDIDNSTKLHRGQVFNSDSAAWYGNDHYNGTYYGGEAYTEQSAYDVWSDPALEELSDLEKEEYAQSRKKVIPKPNDLPAWAEGHV